MSAQALALFQEAGERNLCHHNGCLKGEPRTEVQEHTYDDYGELLNKGALVGLKHQIRQFPMIKVPIGKKSAPPYKRRNRVANVMTSVVTCTHR